VRGGGEPPRQKSSVATVTVTVTVTVTTTGG